MLKRITFYTLCLSFLMNKVSGQHNLLADNYLAQANDFKKNLKPDSALVYYEKALKNKILQRGAGHKDLIRFYKFISDTYYLMGNKLKGEEYKNKGEEIEKS